MNGIGCGLWANARLVCGMLELMVEWKAASAG